VIAIQQIRLEQKQEDYRRELKDTVERIQKRISRKNKNIPESLQKLLHYKKQQRQELILTLNTYLDRNQNLTKTAQEPMAELAKDLLTK